jgi:hypothetical protein
VVVVTRAGLVAGAAEPGTDQWRLMPLPEIVAQVLDAVRHVVEIGQHLTGAHHAPTAERSPPGERHNGLVTFGGIGMTLFLADYTPEQYSAFGSMLGGVGSVLAVLAAGRSCLLRSGAAAVKRRTTQRSGENKR